MKNIFKSILVSSVLLGALTGCGLFEETGDQVIQIEGEPTNNLTYEKLPNWEAKVTGIRTDMETVIIPDSTQIDGITYRVTAIAENAFSNSTVLKSIKFGNNITIVEDNAFFNSSLQNVNFSGVLKSIGNRSFSNCRIKVLAFPTSLQSLGDEAFSNNLITDLNITSGISSIGEKCFDLNKNLAFIKVAEENRYYDSREDSNSIIATATNELIQASNNAIIPTSVVKLHQFSYHGLSFISRIDIPANVREIEPNAISFNQNLKELVVDKYNNVFETRKDTSAIIRSSTNSLCVACNATTSIPNSIIEIESFAFSNTNAIRAISITKNITNVGANAFYGWTRDQIIYLQDDIDTTKWDPEWRAGSNARVIKLTEV